MQANEDVAEYQDIFITTAPATRLDHRLALAAVGISAVLFVCAAPFAKTVLSPFPAFVAGYQSALAIANFITATLIFSQFAILKSRGVLLLATGYLFTGIAGVAHTLTFPGLFSPTGLFGSGPQTSVWLYMIWHGGFPLFVLGYTWMKADGRQTQIRGSACPAIVRSIVLALTAVAAAVWFTTGQHDNLPKLISDGRDTEIMDVVVWIIWGLCLVTLVELWFRRPRSLLDVWLMVTMCAWLFDIGMSTILSDTRYDVGFYAGRGYGLCAASFVLTMLLFDNFALQTKQVRLLDRLRLQAASDKEYQLERDRLFTAVVESSNDAIVTKALDTTITGWNSAATQLYGYTAAEAIGQKIALLVPRDGYDELQKLVARIHRGEAIQQYEMVRLHKSGRPLEVSLSISPLRSANGDIVGASEITRDISEARRAQKALNQEIEERRRIFETSQDLILITDASGNFVQISPSAETILGYEPIEMMGLNMEDFIYPDDLERTRAEMAAARRGQKIRNFENRYVHKDGRNVTLTWMGTWSEPVHRHFFVGRDLTDKQVSEALFRQSQKMEAVGQLTGGIAHDFNNILTVITGTIGILGEAVSDRPELEAIARMIDEAAERGGQLTKHLLAFARKQPLQPREVDVNSLILDAVKLLRPTIGEHIQLEPLLPPDTWPALVDPNQLATAILNLALNARDAMPDGGSIVIESKNTTLDASYADMNIEVTPGHYVMIAVSDTGTGIDPKNLDRVFDPFFTTKEVGKGTGLGLSMVYGLVKQSGGHVKIYSEQGYGTSIKLYLPRATGLDSNADEMIETRPAIGGGETILIVEDDPLVRKYVVGQVQSLGYTTLAACNAVEALEVLNATPGIDLLFTDVIMPGEMNGRRLADEALRQRPSLKVLFTSGYTENAIVHHGRLDSGVLLLAKPYRKIELARMIRTAIDN